MERLLSWEVTGWVVGVGLSVAFAFVSTQDYRLAKLFFLIAAADALGGTAMWSSRTHPLWRACLLAFFLTGGVGVLGVLAFRYTDHKRDTQRDAGQLQPQPGPKTPSLVFVFGAPLGDNDSATWIMLLKHFGPDTAYNCQVEFFDDDRKNLEHAWLAKHPDSPFLPAGMFDKSQSSIYISEADKEGAIGSFQWSPLDPDRQHYTVSVSCRDGAFVERWEVTRVEGVLRAKVVIEHGSQWVGQNPGADPLVFTCQDPQFTGVPLLSATPAPRPKVNPGWKPNHVFAIPVAIIDPSGHVQIMSGVKQPDGSTLTDFGCWNILTKHFGDN